jgi:hypothetical protein
MLHRFVTGWSGKRKTQKGVQRTGAKARVKFGGATKSLTRSFEAKLNNGNMAVVVRTDGGPPDTAYKPMRYSKSTDRLWILYGPSVDQVFKSVREDISPKMSKFMANEFERHFKRLYR